jgi:hypothetical protein
VPDTRYIRWYEIRVFAGAFSCQALLSSHFVRILCERGAAEAGSPVAMRQSQFSTPVMI